MRRVLGFAVLAGILILGFGTAVFAAGETTGTISACATATTPAHTLAVDQSNVYTVPGDTNTSCTTETYTIPTSTVTQTVTVTQTSPTTTTTTTTTSPPPASYYYNFDFQQIAEPPWTSIQTHAPPGYYEPKTPVQQSSDGRIALTTAPDGTGKALRFELDNGDTWPIDTTTDRSQLQMSTQQTWNESALQVGDVRWFDYEIYLPSSFDFPRTNWFTLIGIHPGLNTWGACDLGFDDVGSNSVWMTWKVAGGSPVGTTANLKYIKLWQLTNVDGSQYAPNYNRRIHLVVGARFAPDNTGWLEIWVDGVNVYPRTNRPTMWEGDTSSYLKLGPYKSESSPFPSGKSVIYFTRVGISTTEPPTN